MATPTRGLLYVDILGTKKLWLTRGVSRGRGRLDVFASLATDGVKSAQREFGCQLVTGEIGTDSAAFLFSSVDDAVLAGMRIYQTAFFYDETKQSDARIYLRGVIVRTNDSALPTQRQNFKGLGTVSRVFHSDALMEAVILENSGLRGMRLIVDSISGSEHIWSQASQRYWKSKAASGNPPVVSSLGAAAYPGGSKMLDVLWPIDTRKLLRRRNTRLQARSISAKGDPDEQRQLKATNWLFQKVNQITAKSSR